MRRRRATPPLWFSALLVVAYVAICHVFALHDLETAPVAQAFIGWLIVLGQVIWAGIQATADAVIAFLSWAVNALFWLVQTTFNALVDVAKVAMRGLTKTWQFFRDTYTHVLKPAWLKFWKLVESVQRTLDKVLTPVFKALTRIRCEILQFYDKWIRPIQDTISVARKTLHVLGALHFAWARKLDAKLGWLEEQIDRPFRMLLGKVNELINFVDRIATADGLFQRLALVRSIERDILYIHREFLNAWHHPLTTDERDTATTAAEPKDLAAVTRDVRDYFQTRGGDDAPLIEEQVAQARIYLRDALANTV